MGRSLDRNYSTLQFQKYYRGCLWGLLPLQFQSFKKLMPRVKQKHVRTSTSKPGMNTESNVYNEDQEFEVGSSGSSFKAMENTRVNNSIQASKKNSCSIGKIFQRPRLLRTYSIHHLELPCNFLDHSNVDDKHPVEIHKISDQMACNWKHFSELDQGDVEEDHQSSGHSETSDESYEDFFDAFQIDKKLLLSKQNSDTADSAHCQVDLKSHGRATLRRSGSFPMTNKPCNRFGSMTPSKLESKLTEVRPSSSSSSLSTSSSSFRCSENILPRSLSCTLPVNLSEELATENASNETDHKANEYASKVRRYELSRLRRASTLNASLERYTQLFETGFRRDAKRLSLSNEDGVGFFNPSDTVFLRKVQSMREVPQVEWPSDNIELSRVPNISASFSNNSEPSDSDVNIDESCAGFEQQLILNFSSGPKLSNEQQIESGFESYSDAPQPLAIEDAKTATNDQEDFLEDSVLGTDDTVTSSYQQNAMKILESLGSEVRNELDEQLLFDLVNEGLEIDGRFDAYWPTPLCTNFNCHMLLLPFTEHHVTRKIESRIQKLNQLSIKSSNSVDDIVSYDLAQCDSWINLQADAESLGLALGEMILDELLEEFMYK